MENLDLQINIVVNGSFGDGACGKCGGPDMIRIHNQRLRRGTGEKKGNYERSFVAEILAGAVFMNGIVAPPDGFNSMFILVLAGTGATKNVIST